MVEVLACKTCDAVEGLVNEMHLLVRAASGLMYTLASDHC